MPSTPPPRPEGAPPPARPTREPPKRRFSYTVYQDCQDPGEECESYGTFDTPEEAFDLKAKLEPDMERWRGYRWIAIDIEEII